MLWSYNQICAPIQAAAGQSRGEARGDAFCGASGLMVGLDDLEGLFEP